MKEARSRWSQGRIAWRWAAARLGSAAGSWARLPHSLEILQLFSAYV